MATIEQECTSAVTDRYVALEGLRWALCLLTDPSWVGPVGVNGRPLEAIAAAGPSTIDDISEILQRLNQPEWDALFAGATDGQSDAFDRKCRREAARVLTLLAGASEYCAQAAAFLLDRDDMRATTPALAQQ